MAVYLVTWDLNKERTNYANARDRVVAHLARYSHIKDPGLDSVWFLDSAATADAVYGDIKSVFDTNDRVIVTKLHNGTHQGWLHEDVWKWINARA